MKKKLIPIITILVCALLLTLSACSGYNQKAIGGGPDVSAPVTNNGSMVVQKGDYYYYINGKAEVEGENKFGSTVKGAIVRTKIDELYDTTKQQIIVPKIVLNSYQDAGFYIFGDTIYYTSPNDAKNKEGTVETAYLNFMKTKLDGTGTVKLGTVSSNSLQHKYFEKDGKVMLAYIDSSKVYVLDCETKKLTEFVSEYTGTPLFLASGDVVYTAAVYYNIITDEDDDSAVAADLQDTDKKLSTRKYNKVMKKNVFETEAAMLKKDSKFTFTVSNTEVANGKEYVYFSKSEVGGGNKEQGFYRMTSSLDIDNAVLVSTQTSLSGFLTAPDENGYIIHSGSAIWWYGLPSNGSVQKPLVLASSATLYKIIRKNGVNYLYYLNADSNLERIALPSEAADNSVWLPEESNKTIILGSDSLDTMSTDWIRPVYLGNTWFFFNSGSNVFNKTEGEYDHVSLYVRNGYTFAFTEPESYKDTNGEDVDIPPAKRIGILTADDKKTETDTIETENKTRDKNNPDLKNK